MSHRNPAPRDSGTAKASLIRTTPDARLTPLLNSLRVRLHVAGYSVTELEPDRLADEASLAGTDLLVIPAAAELPATAARAIETYTRSAARIITLGAPVWGATSDQDQTALPRADLLSPSYKFFDMTGVRNLAVRSDQRIVRGGTLPLPRALRSPHPRAKGGFNKGRSWRWIPLVEGRTATGEWRGTPAALIAHLDGPCAGSVLASFGVDDVDWYGSAAALDLLEDLARWMRDPVLMLDGGTDHYTYFDDQDVTLGIRAGTLATPTTVIARVTIRHRGSGETLTAGEWPLTLTPGEITVASAPWRPSSFPDEGCDVTAELVSDGVVIDRLDHDVHVWKPSAESRFITVQDGSFMCDGREWRPHGVNYMPSSGVATEDFPYFHQYLSSPSYDPEVIERDLAHIVEMGLNAISIFVFEQDSESLNLLDLLRRARTHDLKANLSLRPSNIAEQWGLLSEVGQVMPRFAALIERYRLSQNDAVFAFDLVWEPQFGSTDTRRMWDAAWERWITERYGTVANAERDWGHAIPRDPQGAITNPSPSQMEVHGPSFRMVAAYRRFLDTVLYTQWAEARRIIRGADPNHLVSFRMWHAGDPTYTSTSALAYDFPYLAGAVDFLGPEAYGRIGPWDRVKPGRFTFEWARLAAPNLPVVWAEIGVQVAGLRPTAAESRFQAEYFADFQRMMISSGASGVFYWFYPGGYRVDDAGQDYGLINPDGSDRPVTAVIRAWAPTFRSGSKAGAIDHWIEVDRDARAEGLVGVYQEAEAEFWAAIDKGLTPGLRTAGTATDSATCPRLAVGNTQCDGTNPPKYLDAAFDAIEVLGTSGVWSRVVNGGTALVPGRGPVSVRVSITNLGEAAWLNGSTTGSVGLDIEIDGARLARAGLPSPLHHLESITLPQIEIPVASSDQPVNIVFRLTAEGVSAFGERFDLRLRPVSA